MTTTCSHCCRLFALVVWGAALGFSSLPGQARAQAQVAPETEHYRDLIARALEEYNAARYEEARALFLQAHALRPSARTFRGLGMTEFELRHYAQALRLIALAQADQRHPLTDEQRREVSAVAERANAFVGHYHVALQPTGAALTIDGTPVDNPNELTLDIGAHTLQATAEGHVPESLNLDVQGAEDVTLNIQLTAMTPEALPALTAEPADLQPSAANSPVTLSSESAPIVQPGAAAQPSDRQSFPARPVVGWVSLGVGVVGVAGALIAWRVGENAADHWNDDALCLRGDRSREQNCGRYRRSVHAARTWTIVGVVVAVAGAAGASLLLWPSGSADGGNARALACGDGIGEIGVVCTMRF